MKIYLDTTFIKPKDYQQLISDYPKHQYTFTEDEDCDVIVGFFGRKEQNFFDQFKQLKWIILISSGYNHLDFNYLTKRGITVTNAKGVYGISISEDVVSKMLYFDKNIYQYIENQQNHLWQSAPPHHEMYEKQALILGTGSIGLEIAKRLKGFDMEVIGYKSKPEELLYFDQIITSKSKLNEFYKTCDYLIITLPSNKHTKHFVNKETFDLLKPSTLLINIARGDIILQEDLVKALQEGKIRGAALDVVTPEPLPYDHILWSMHHVLITPHSSSLSPRINERRIKMIIKLLTAFDQKQPLFNIVLDGDMSEQKNK